ncbi:MAG: hypothetical protein JSS68_00340 [Actinobacteria bacterium]|nr:hypothetical protein [Actinomycetota bacterium]
MKSKFDLGRGAAILACAASLAGTAAVIAPTAASAATTCADKTIKIQVEGSKPIPLPVKAITTEGGVSCAEAYKVIAGVLTGEPPSGWKSYGAHFPTPEGLVPQGVKKGSKKIKFATRGG